MQDKLIIGLDVAKATFTAATRWQGTLTYAGQFAQTPAACDAFAAEVEALAASVGAAAIHLIIEPTGGYEAAWMAEAYQRGWLVTRVNPWAVRTWGQSLGYRTKTDRRDACLLAQFGAETDPPAQAPLPDAVTELDDLLRRQTVLEQLLRGERNRQARLARMPRPSPAVTESLRRTIEALEHELATINNDIQQLFAQQPVLKRQRQQLLTLPGVGAKIAPYLLVILYRFQAYTQAQGTAKGLVAFLGLDPALYESGTSVHRRPTISRKGDQVMRTKLYLGAQGGIRGANPLTEFYRSLLARNKPKKVALVACARKIAVWAWAIFVADTSFDAARFNSKPLGA